MQEFKHLKRWTMPKYYFGAEWPEWFVVYGQHRDSDALERSNFRSLLKLLRKVESKDGVTSGDDKDMESVTVVRASHWGVGWVEWIGIHESDTQALAAAEELLAALADYPVVDDEDHSQLEDEECSSTWERCYSPKERVKYFRGHGHTFSSLAQALSAVRGDWHSAASALNCPSDLLR